MANKKQELEDLFGVVISCLRNNKFTIVMNNCGSTKGQLYQISKGTHEQAKTNNFQYIMFSGTTSETIKYLQGMRDLFTDIFPFN